MERSRRILFAKTVVVLGAIPLVIWAHEYGPDAGHTGVPRELGDCTGIGCHAGTANNSANRGSVAVNFPSGLTYRPGVTQRLSVTIADQATTQRAWGFQFTARVSSSTATMAGSFTSADNNTGVLCASATNVNDQAGDLLAFGKTQTCPGNRPLAYMEHTLAGYTATRGTTGSATYQFDWTPPATDVGNITIYVAGNAANGDLTVNGDHIFTTTYTLTPSAGGSAPAISENGVINGAGFQPGVVANSWVAIKGTNLSTATSTWDKLIKDGQLPTTLEDVSVTIGGKPAYIYFVSPVQINVLAPDVGTGSVAVVVKNAAGTSAAFTANAVSVQPACFLFDDKHPVATRQDFTLAVANGTFPGLNTAAAKPGEVIILWGTGFGPTTPATPVGVQVPASLFSTASPVTVTVGGTNATVFGAALAPGFAGLYQVAIQIPDNAPDGELPVVATINGAQSPVTTVLTIKK